MNAREVLCRMLAGRLDEHARAWLDTTLVNIAAGTDGRNFALLFSKAVRYAPRRPLDPNPAEIEAAAVALAGWNPERWTALEALRVLLLLTRPDLEEDSFNTTLEECFRYADQGETVALYRSLALLPGGRRFLWRAGEGCRSNMSTVFEALACDNPYAFTHFDDVAWRQLAIKAVFIDAPLWRVYGLDRRLSEELASMALDLADERRSAGRPVQPQLWLCLGSHGSDRAIEALKAELEAGDPSARAAAVLALARAGHPELAGEALARERDERAAATMRQASRGRSDQALFASLGAPEL